MRRFVSRGEQEAFAILIQRHGPTVLGVCRRILRDSQDTEDAFQAAFVVLARKASTVINHDSLTSWLYKVTYRIALRLRLDKARRFNREHHIMAMNKYRNEANFDNEGGLNGMVRRELHQMLDEEVHRLPEKYRAPILLCYHQGQTNEEAAALLRCPTGTIKIRLLRGREMLRKRLAKRGLALSITVSIGETLADLAQAAVPQPLAHAAARSVSGAAAPTVAELAGSAIKKMCLAKLKVAALVLLTLGLTCWTNSLMSRGVAAAAEPRFEQHLPTFDATPSGPRSDLLASLED
jgi:RNA polymerase sigma factor (sigma-70 family)